VVFLAKLFRGVFSIYVPFISPERTVKLRCVENIMFYSLGVPVKGYNGAYTWIFRGVFINFAGTNSEAAMGRAACLYEIFWLVSRPLIFQGRKYFYYILPP
jgi:hypothetical protein